MTPDEFKHAMIQLDLVGVEAETRSNDTYQLANERIYVSTKYKNMYLCSTTAKWSEITKEYFDKLLKKHVELANGKGKD